MCSFSLIVTYFLRSSVGTCFFCASLPCYSYFVVKIQLLFLYILLYECKFSNLHYCCGNVFFPVIVEKKKNLKIVSLWLTANRHCHNVCLIVRKNKKKHEALDTHTLCTPVLRNCRVSHAVVQVCTCTCIYLWVY